MDIRSLRYFTETVRHGSFTEAAKALGVTQSTISKMIRQLEDEVGEVLLLRDGSLRLTDTGKVMLERGRDVLKAMERLQMEIRETQSVSRGSLALGMPPMINTLFTGALKRFRDRYPGVELKLHEDAGVALERRVANGELAAGMSVFPMEPQPGLAVARVASHRVWALGVESLLRSNGDSVGMRSLGQLPLVLLNDDFALTRLLRRQFARAGIEPRIVAQSGHWDWTIAMARVGMGVALLPQPFVESVKADDLVCMPVSQPEIHWDIALFWDTRHVSHALTAWLDVCREQLGGDWPEQPAA